jgi:Zn-dependent peptidase ImmA (M78 family)
MINGDRIKQAREIKGWTQKQLADRIGIKQTTVSQVESGVLQASDEIIQRVVLQTGFPPAFFKQSNTIDFPLGSLLYRKRSSLTLRERSQARQYARIIFEIIKKLESNYKKIPHCIPRLEESPSICAIQTRSNLSLSPDSPIDNLVFILEKKGVVVLALPIALDNMDAFSVWVGNNERRPVIALSKNVEHGDRLRFSLAHELGHLVMHQAMTGDINQIDREADEFASEFLTPKDVIEKEIIRPVTIASLLPLKKRWKVSIRSLIRCAYQVGAISENQYKYLMIQISKQGGKNEPIKISPEKPRLLGQLAEMQYNSPIDYKALASNMNLPVQLIIETLDVHSVKEQHHVINNANGEVIDFNNMSKAKL